MKAEDSIQLVGSRKEDDYSSCVDYVIRLLAKNCGMAVGTGTEDEAASAAAALPSPRILLLYCDEDANTPPRSATQFDACVIIRRSTFFGPTFMESPDLPAPAEKLLAAASMGGLNQFVTRIDDTTVSLSLDIIAASFWFLTRYEEYLITSHDEHGRFLCSDSMAPAEMYDLPVVNRWFEGLYTLIRELLKLPKDVAFLNQRHTIALTHDVDLMRKYRGLRGARRALASMAQGSVTEASGEMRHASLVLAGIRRDPYDSFDDLFTLKERIGAPSTFFFMGGGKAPLDGDYRLDEPNVRTLISRVKSFGDEICVHPSYDSYKSQSTITSEIAGVSNAAGKMVHGTRQHYLRFAVPETWRMLAAANMRYDSSLAFPDYAGFRCGWSGCFHPFDIETRQELPIIEIPLIVMDVTLSIYEKISAEHSLERIARLLEASNARRGAFVFLWHNTIRDKKVHGALWDTFEYFFFAAAGSARFVTMRRLCDEFEKA